MPRRSLIAVATTYAFAVGTAIAQEDELSQEICDNQLVVAMDNLITLLAAVGPVIGALVAMASMLVLTYTQNPRKKKKWTKTRNDAIKYGVGILFVGAIMNLLIQVTSPDMATCIDVVGV
ncbi:MAG: hypothetical protein ACOCT0_01280 [Halobacteriota archaeon]